MITQNQLANDWEHIVLDSCWQVYLLRNRNQNYLFLDLAYVSVVQCRALCFAMRGRIVIRSSSTSSWLVRLHHAHNASNKGCLKASVWYIAWCQLVLYVLQVLWIKLWLKENIIMGSYIRVRTCFQLFAQASSGYLTRITGSSCWEGHKIFLRTIFERYLT